MQRCQLLLPWLLPLVPWEDTSSSRPSVPWPYSGSREFEGQVSFPENPWGSELRTRTHTFYCVSLSLLLSWLPASKVHTLRNGALRSLFSVKTWSVTDPKRHSWLNHLILPREPGIKKYLVSFFPDWVLLNSTFAVWLLHIYTQLIIWT